ncbi:hypothetical protein H4R34_005111 [Dimargaris verticillata]|uniref:Uncharacterized protein n=1 Tax=Dimargaris verticillata TaxID=2761393 RepID=A0A9W8AX31_9FUNG|nr:hypothetical protein H4R34_005111 [Dimargaris verticillata]
MWAQPIPPKSTRDLSIRTLATSPCCFDQHSNTSHLRAKDIKAIADSTVAKLQALQKDPTFPHLGLVNEYLWFDETYGSHASVASFHPTVSPVVADMHFLMLESFVQTGHLAQGLALFCRMYQQIESWCTEATAPLPLNARTHLESQLNYGLTKLFSLVATSRDLEWAMGVCQQWVDANQLGDITVNPAVVDWRKSPQVWSSVLGVALSPSFALLPHRRTVTKTAYDILKAWHSMVTTQEHYVAYLLADLRYHGYANDADRVHAIWQCLEALETPTRAQWYQEYIAALARVGNFNQATRVYHQWRDQFGPPLSIEPLVAILISHAEVQQLSTAMTLYQSEQAQVPNAASDAPALALWHSSKWLELSLHHAACYFNCLPASLHTFHLDRAPYEKPITNHCSLSEFPSHLNRLVGALRSTGYQLTVHDYNELVKSYMYCHHHQPLVVTYDHVMGWYQAMKNRDVQPNLETHITLLWHASLSYHRALNEQQRALMTFRQFNRLQQSGLDYKTTRVYVPLLLSCLPLSRIRDLSLPYVLSAPISKIDPRFYTYKAELDAMGIPLDEFAVAVYMWGLGVSGDIRGMRSQWRGMGIFGIRRTERLYSIMLNCMARQNYLARYALAMLPLDMTRESPAVTLTPALRLALLKCCITALDYQTATQLLQDVPLTPDADSTNLYTLYMKCCFMPDGQPEMGYKVLKQLRAMNPKYHFIYYEAPFHHAITDPHFHQQATKLHHEYLHYHATQESLTPRFVEYLHTFGLVKSLGLPLDPTAPPKSSVEEFTFTEEHSASHTINPDHTSDAAAVPTEALDEATTAPTVLASRHGTTYIPFAFLRNEISLIVHQVKLHVVHREYSKIPAIITWLVAHIPPRSQIAFNTREELSILGQLLVEHTDDFDCWCAALRLMDMLVYRLKLPAQDVKATAMLGAMLKTKFRRLPLDQVTKACQSIDPQSVYLFYFKQNLHYVLPKPRRMTLRSYENLTNHATS